MVLITVSALPNSAGTQLSVPNFEKGGMFLVRKT